MELKSFIKKTNYKRTFLLLLVGMLTLSNLFAQNSATIKIRGSVTDNKSKETIIGASVVIKGTSNGTITDIDGDFQLDTPADATLVISYVGYKTKEVAVANKTSHPILLEEDTEMLEEVVVIGYGQVRKGDATGSLLTLKPDALNKGLQVTAQDAMVGKIAGVNIVPGTGAPGSDATIRIRMGASLKASNDPLIVIDGVPVENTSINSINPNDIASFTVLKDASATAIYGSRASNGVIIITTKKGDAGSSTPRINYSSSFSISEVSDYFDVLSADEYREAFKKHATSAPSTFLLGNASTDWQKEIYRTAFGTDHNLSVTGAVKQIPYRVSVGYTNQNGVIIENNYQRFNGGIGLSPKFFEKHLAVDINVKGSIERDKPISNKIDRDGDRPSSPVIGGAIFFDPTRPTHDRMGYGYYMWLNSSGNPISLAPSNPLADLELTDKLNKTQRSIGNIAADYKIHGFEDLHLNMNLGYDIRKISYDETTPQYAPSMYTGNQFDGTGKVYTRERHNRNYLLDLYANYSKDINDKHSISAMGGYGWQRFWYDTKDKTTDTFGKDLPGVTSVIDKGELYLLSFFGRFNYTFAQKLMLTATLRADASSRFSPDNRWGYFPSVALGYRLTEEAFMKNITALSDLKLRASYGQTGQQNIGGNYAHLGTYTSSYDNARYPFDGNWTTTVRPNGYDPNIKWETTSTYNIGLDYGFLNNRIYGSIDAYKRYTKDLLNEIAVPAGSNFSSVLYTNVGDMDSKGIEMALTGVLVKNKDWEWTASGNFTYGTAKIKKLNSIDTDDNYIKTGRAGGRNDLQVHKVGETPNTFFLLQQAYDDDGKPLDGKYVAKDGSITSSEADANKYVTGKSSRTPYYYGLSTRLMYKEWDLGVNGHGSFGNYVFNYQEASQSLDNLYSANGVSSNISRTTLNNGFAQQRVFSDYFLESGAFFKIDNITLGYTFHKLWNTSSSLRLAFTAQNIATITSYSGVDPEVYDGIDRNTYQRPRVYTLSLNLNF